MGCHSNRLRLGKHMGAKFTVLHTREIERFGGGGRKKEMDDRNKMHSLDA